MNLELTIIVSAISFIVMLIVLANLHTKMTTIITLLNVLIKKISTFEEKVKWDDDYIKTKLEKIETQNKPQEINWKG